MNAQIAEVAEGQHGLFTLEQAATRGVTASALKTALRTGTCERVAEGVYRIIGAPRTWEQRLMTLTLVSTPAAASHRSAAALLRIPGFAPGPLEVTTTRPLRHRTVDRVVHSSRILPGSHLAVIGGVPSTRAARTLVDLAGVLHPARVERAVDSCLSANLVSLEALHTTFGDLAGRGRRGIAAMRSILEERGGGFVAPASELEARFLALVRSAGLPEPVRQLDAGDTAGWIGRVDFAYPTNRLLIELDGRRWHTAKLDLEADRRRDNQLVATGWRVIRVTWEQLCESPDDVATLMLRALQQVAA